MKVLVVVLVLVVAACGSSGPSSSSDPNVIPPDLVPASYVDAAVTVTLTGGQPVAVPAAVLTRVVPFLVRRVFDAPEALSEYGLDAPIASVTFADSMDPITLTIGAQVFDQTAYYVQRVGDGRVWLVLTESIAPLLAAG
ncbi:MAG: hypothetical protein QOE63_2047 [Acidimicrobiaceae bacterium]|jgi:hypothetical protein